MNNEIVLKANPKSVVSEDIRTIRTNLEFCLSEYDKKIVMVTSSLPAEGKSFISSNLSVALAQNGNKVLLIDCDLRMGRIHKIFNLTNKVGLSNLIVKYNEVDEIEEYVKKTDIKNLFIIPRGTVPPNPSELLSSKRFENIVGDFKQLFDYIILDCVPVNGLPDALVLSKIADKTIIVTKYGSTNIDALEDTKKALNNVDASVAGVVVNRIPKSKTKYGSYYYGENDDWSTYSYNL